MKLKIKKGDTVQILAGADKGKKGEVIEVAPATLKIKIQGIKVMTHYDRKEGLLKKEGFVDYSNVKLVEKKAQDAKKKTTKKKATTKSA